MDYEGFITGLGRTIKYERVRRGYSQEGLAEAARMHRNHLSAVERGAVNVSVHNLLRLAEALHLPLSRLIAEAEELTATEGASRG